VLPDCNVTAAEFRDYVRVTTHVALESFLDACPIYNGIVAEEQANRKPTQLYVARRVGLRVPRTLISNDWKTAECFVRQLWSEGKEVIYKHVAIGTAESPPTRLLKEEDLNRLYTAVYCPTTFQERICGGADLRVVVIGETVFAAEWRPAAGATEGVDIRLDYRARMWPAKLPAEEQVKLLLLHQALGLTFGVYDLKVNEEGAVVFLEVNPSGQWLDVEVDGGYPVSEAVARLLAHGAAATTEVCGAPLTNQDLAELWVPAPDQTLPAQWAGKPFFFS
jgi:glutathione synthase/RimK-type ligase-like ATP-grasp enzyme